MHGKYKYGQTVTLIAVYISSCHKSAYSTGRSKAFCWPKTV